MATSYREKSAAGKSGAATLTTEAQDFSTTFLRRAVRAGREKAAGSRPNRDGRSDTPQAEASFEASSRAREMAYAQLRKEAVRFGPVQERLQAIGSENPEEMVALLDAAGTGMERYILALEAAVQAEASYRFAQGAHDTSRRSQKDAH